MKPAEAWTGDVREVDLRRQAKRSCDHFGIHGRLAALAVTVLLSRLLWGTPPLRRHKRAVPPDFAEILSRMNEAAKRLRTVSTSLDYSKFTALVNDKDTESGQLYFQKEKGSKRPEILINFEKPDPKVILFSNNKAELYLPKINQIQEYDMGRHSELVQQFLLLGFGTEVGELQKSYNLKLVGEEDIDDETAAVVELSPRGKEVAAQLTKVQLWISEDSWLPVQQKVFQPDGDYLLARYSSMKVNRQIPSSKFVIQTERKAKRVKMN